MVIERREVLDKILLGYERSYNISEIEDPQTDLPLVATADLHVSESGFVLVRKAQMWSTNSNEFVYIFSVDKLEEDLCRKAIEYAYEKGLEKIDLEHTKDHMCSRIVALFLCDRAEPDAVKCIQKCRLYKSFQFSLKGWAEVHTVVCDLENEVVESNRYGRETAEYLRSLLYPQPEKKNKRKWGILKQMLQ